MGDQPLREKFPRLYAILLYKENVLNDLGKWDDEVCNWNLRWRWELFNWEIERLQQLFEMINNSRWNRQVLSSLDNQVWSQDSS